jgi:cell division GTPase FtsZ
MDLFANGAGTICAIGVGSLGGRVASLGAANADGCGGALWAVAHCDRAELLATGLERKIHLDVMPGPIAAPVAEQVAAEREDEVAALLAGRSVVMLLGSLGEAAGSTLLPALAKVLRRRKLFVCVIACDPLPFQDDPLILQENIAERLHAESDLFIRISPAVVAAGLNPDLPVSAIIAAAERKTLAVAETLTGVLSENVSGFTLPSLRQTLRGGGPLTLGLGIARGCNAPLLAADAALRHIAPERLEMDDNAPAGIAAAVVSGRELSVSEAEALREICRTGSGTQKPAALTLLGHCRQEHMDTEAVCLLLVRYAGSRNVVSMF